MKIILSRCALAFAAFSLSASCWAQPTTSQSAPSTAGNYTIVGRTPFTRQWQMSTVETNAAGLARTNIQSYVEARSGLCYVTNGVLADSIDEIDLVSDGAQAVHGQHHVHWMANANTPNGAIQLVSASGNVFQSAVFGICYWDTSTGTNLIIGSIQDSQGTLIGNQVIYENAFKGVDADLVYTYSVEGLEQNVVFREQLPDPASYNLNPDTTLIQILTQFFDPPVPNKVSTQIDGAENDLCLDFEDMAIGVGDAFLANTEAGTITAGPVRKYWGQLNKLDFLIEELPFNEIAGLQSALPEHASISKPLKRISRMAALKEQPKLAKPKNFGSIKLAQTYTAKPGLVVDYNIVNSTNYALFQGDTTYYVSGTVSLSGTNIWEGGTVIKLTNSGSISEVSSPQISFKTGPYRPVVFTSKDDNSVGSAITGSTGNPWTNYCGNPVIGFGSASVTVTNIRVSFASEAISSSANSTFMDAQFVHCSSGISESGAVLTLKNALFAKVPTPLYSLGGSGTKVVAENATFDNSVFLATFTTVSAGTTVSLTNCILSRVTNTIGYPASSPSPYTGYTPAANYNGFYSSTSFGANAVTSSSSPFAPFGAGSYYLTNASTFLNAGTGSLDSALLTDLAQKTVYQPMTNGCVGWFINNTTLFPQAQRDSSTTPSLGWHYDPIDWAISDMAISNATLTVLPGTAVAAAWIGNGNCGIYLYDNAYASFQGTATSPCYFCRYNMAQEQSTTNWIPSSSWSGLLAGQYLYTANSSANFRFTIWTGMSDEPFAVDDIQLNPVIFNDCQFYNGALYSQELEFQATNCLFQRADVELYDDDGIAAYNFFNNLFIGGTFDPSEEGTVSTFKDNFFDHTSILADGPPDSCDYNGYVTNCNRLTASTHDVVLLASPAYQVGTMGQYYYPTNALFHAGSRTAAAAGLYHFTVMTNNVVEGNNQVSIGYHFVATDAYGNPLDTNGDGIPDYLEDANGNGLVDSGEIGWNVSGDLGLTVIITQPASNSKIP